jgi:hypothetical protein
MSNKLTFFTKQKTAFYAIHRNKLTLGKIKLH